MWRIFDTTTSLTASASTYATLLAALQAMASGVVSVTTASGGIISTSANGHSVTFDRVTSGNSQMDYAANAGELRDLYQNSKAALISAGDASPTDTEIFDEMMDRLQSIREYGPSQFIDLRNA